MHIDDLLIHMEARDASDLYLKSGVPPMLRIAGNLVPAGEVPLTDEAVYGLAEQLMTDRHRQEFAEHHRADILSLGDLEAYLAAVRGDDTEAIGAALAFARQQLESMN